MRHQRLKYTNIALDKWFSLDISSISWVSWGALWYLRHSWSWRNSDVLMMMTTHHCQNWGSVLLLQSLQAFWMNGSIVGEGVVWARAFVGHPLSHLGNSDTSNLWYIFDNLTGRVGMLPVVLVPSFHQVNGSGCEVGSLPMVTDGWGRAISVTIIATVCWNQVSLVCGWYSVVKYHHVVWHLCDKSWFWTLCLGYWTFLGVMNCWQVLRRASFPGSENGGLFLNQITRQIHDKETIYKMLVSQKLIQCNVSDWIASSVSSTVLNVIMIAKFKVLVFYTKCQQIFGVVLCQWWNWAVPITLKCHKQSAASKKIVNKDGNDILQPQREHFLWSNALQLNTLN